MTMTAYPPLTDLPVRPTREQLAGYLNVSVDTVKRRLDPILKPTRISPRRLSYDRETVAKYLRGELS